MHQDHYTLTTEDKGSHVLVRASGFRTRATVIAMTIEIFDAILATRLSKALIDVRELKGRLGILDIYIVVTEVFQKLRGKGVRKVAIVDERVSSSRDWLIETIARNRGFNFRVFSDQEDALEWLDL